MGYLKRQDTYSHPATATYKRMDSDSEALRECPSCALDVPADSTTCPYCNYEFPVQKGFFKPVVALFVFLMLGWIFAC